MPLLPIMPSQGGQVLSQLTQEEPFREPVAAVVRPCEVRAFFELVKRNKGSLDNLVLISPECPGVFPVQRASGDLLEDELDDLYLEARQGHIDRLDAGICLPEADVIFIETLRNLERIGDHADNLGISVMRN